MGIKADKTVTQPFSQKVLKPIGEVKLKNVTVMESDHTCKHGILSLGCIPMILSLT